MENRQIAKAINDSPYKIYMAVTGGGAGFIGDYLSYGGGSNTILGFEVPYHPKAFDIFCGQTIGKYCNVKACENLAIAARRKACMVPIEGAEHIGIGVTASLCRGDIADEREGRFNGMYIAILFDDRIVTKKFTFDGKNRDIQEKQCIDVIYKFLAEELLNGMYTVDYTNKPLIVFPGSFNPPHEAHFTMFDTVKQMYPEHQIVFEISFKNRNKPNITVEEFEHRKKLINSRVDNKVLGTFAPMIDDKIREFGPGTIFILGGDTYNRWVMDNRRENKGWSYYTNLLDNNHKFIVFPRGGMKSIITDIILPDGLVEFIEDFNMDISSTQLRDKQKQ